MTDPPPNFNCRCAVAFDAEQVIEEADLLLFAETIVRPCTRCGWKDETRGTPATRVAELEEKGLQLFVCELHALDPDVRLTMLLADWFAEYVGVPRIAEVRAEVASAGKTIDRAAVAVGGESTRVDSAEPLDFPW